MQRPVLKAPPRPRRVAARLLSDQRIAGSLISVAGLVGAPVRNQAGAEVGTVDDVVVRWQGEPYPPMTGLLVKVGRRQAWLSATQVEALGRRDVQLRSARLDLRDAVRRPGEVALNADVIDHQMVDVDGVRVFRAADLYLARLDDHVRLVGADIGFATLLRRLGPSRWRGVPTPDRVIDWAAIQPFTQAGQAGEPVRLTRPNEELHRLRPGELADLLEDLGRPQREELLAALGTEEAADALEEMEVDDLINLLRELPPEKTAKVVAEMAPDEAAEALRELDPETRDELLEKMDAAVAAELVVLLGYPEESAGGAMTTDVVAMHRRSTVRQAQDHLRTIDDAAELTAVTVVDDDGSLVGDLGAMELFLADPDRTLAELVEGQEPACIQAEASFEEVVEALVEGRSSSVVVVDDAGRPLGRIVADDVVD
ncbi:MAG TPA: CBS domain-containing protein, partial [Acidimicrobiales bacterium]|nr:CBS domain-containing protein [Acidimicrobiales bacterium]